MTSSSINDLTHFLTKVPFPLRCRTFFFFLSSSSDLINPDYIVVDTIRKITIDVFIYPFRFNTNPFISF